MASQLWALESGDGALRDKAENIGGLGIEPGASSLLHKHSMSELHPSQWVSFKSLQLK